jgi:hypothetical protein
LQRSYKNYKIEPDVLRYKHIAARMTREVRLPLAQLRRLEQHQATIINWLLGPDHSQKV